MYNSLVVGMLVSLWEIMQDLYQYSLLKKIHHTIKRLFGNLAAGSKFIGLFTSDKKLIEESFLYKLYARSIDGINKVIGKIRSYMKKLSEGSLAYKAISGSFKDARKTQLTGSLFFMVLGIGMLGINIVKGDTSYDIYIASTILIAISLVGFNIDYKQALEGSHIFKFIKSIFTIDEGVDQWW